ncbi:MAG: type II toxin-antitoxin system RelE/ParE family toxin [Calditrichaeota bacterium]|nr:MAG: type II toxin-antitoxin system RelE/ParE family toxin [Calditrichota bacterium]MBL1207745.1 type II toxin-antitoxin system RelE/ParE family toxin [Calditrichota bacterium]NOG47579.1 type II toxin-antitoxin system RelE/ParE family toxin [Calditrichota bacterium]
MNFNVTLTPSSLKDINEIFEYVYLNDSLNNATKLISRIEESIFSLDTFPLRGHSIPELESLIKKNYKEIHFKPYRIIYRVEDRDVYILAVLDGRRNIRELLLRRIDD